MARPPDHAPAPNAPRPARRMAGDVRRVQIVDAARAVFLESGYGGARTQRIAERAEVNQALLYKHFPSKRALFEAAVLDPLEAMIAELAGLIADVVDDDVAARRRARFEEMHRLVSCTCVRVVPLLGIALFTEGGQAFYTERLVPLLGKAYEGTEQLLASWPVHQQLDGRTAFTMTFGMHLGLALDAYMRGEQLEVERVSAVLADVVVRGLSRPARGPTKTQDREQT